MFLPHSQAQEGASECCTTESCLNQAIGWKQNKFLVSTFIIEMCEMIFHFLIHSALTVCSYF